MFAALAFLAVEAAEALFGVATTVATYIIIESAAPALVEGIGAEAAYFETAQVVTEVAIQASTKIASSITKSHIEKAIEEGINMAGYDYSHSEIKKKT